MENQKKYSVKNLEKGKYEISLTIPASAFEQSYNKVLQESAKDMNLKGFRKGKVPASSIENQLQGPILKETFEKLAPNYVLQAIMEEKLQPVMPAVYKEMPKILIGTDVKFAVTVITAPEFKLPKLKKIKVKKESVEVSDEEIEKTIENMWKQTPVKNEGKDKGDKDKGEKGKKSDKKSKSKKKGKPDDKWAKKVAKKYGLKDVKSLAALKKQLKDTFQQQKEMYVTKQYQQEIFNKAIEMSKIEIPEEVIEYEAHQREHSFMHRLQDAKTNLKDWLKENNMTVEDLEKAWKEDAEQALKEHFFLVKYAQENDIKAREEQIQNYIAEIKKQRKDFKETPEWRNMIESVFIKQNALSDLLSKFSPKPKDEGENKSNSSKASDSGKKKDKKGGKDKK
ncbi:hypothetical protein GF357_05015 [Candidatus Dojkabacteria bacterium]|nr:hypothetical protein [Candidatus Dojkabacteria bacterium]